MRSRLLRWLHCWHSGGLPALRLPSHWPRQPVSPGTDSKTSHSTSIYSSRQRCVQPTLPCLQQILLSHKFWSLIHFRFRTNQHEISCVLFPTEIIWLCVLTSFKSGFIKTKKRATVHWRTVKTFLLQIHKFFIFRFLQYSMLETPENAWNCLWKIFFQSIHSKRGMSHWITRFSW